MPRSIIAGLALALATAFAPSAKAAGNLGLGIHLGSAQDGSGFTGLNVRVGQDESLDLVGAWNGGGSGTMILNGNYLHHVAPVLREVPIKAIVPYVGIGIGTWINDKTGAWIQVPLGIDLRFNIPLEAGLYIAPGIDLIPSTNANMHLGISFRYWL